MSYQFNPFSGTFDVSVKSAGITSSIQYNSGNGSFGGSSDLTWDDTAKELGVGGDINLDDGGTYATTLQVITPTANRTISFPDATGTVALVAGSNGQLIYNNAGAYAGAPSSAVGATGNITLSLAGAASTPPVSLTGTWFTGGTSTTTKPQFLIEPTGTTSTAWSTSGTGLGVNAASGFSGNLLDLQVGGTRSFFVTADGSFGTTGGVGVKSRIISGNHYVFGIGNREGIYFDVGSDNVGIPAALIVGGNTANTTAGRIIGDGNHTIAQRNGTNAQTYRLYNTYTSATDFERLNVRWASNEAIIDTEAGSGGGTLRGLKIGSAGTSLLGFYGATPVVQPTAVADITTTATSGSLPTPDGSVTIADATTPTVTELLEYCVELEAKLEAALGHLRTLGLIAT